jgi:hypothetical protein
MYKEISILGIEMSIGFGQYKYLTFTMRWKQRQGGYSCIFIRPTRFVFEYSKDLPF